MKTMRYDQMVPGDHLRTPFYFPHVDNFNRTATWIFYLDDTEEGGETMFVNVPAKGHEKDFKPLYGIDSGRAEGIYKSNGPKKTVDDLVAACTSGHYLRVKPKKGAALLWYVTVTQPLPRNRYATTQPRSHANTQPSSHATTQPRNHVIAIASLRSWKRAVAFKLGCG